MQKNIRALLKILVTLSDKEMLIRLTMNSIEYPDEWTQKEFLENKAKLEKEGIRVLLVDTILAPIEKADTITYNPYELKQQPKGSLFVFYCDTGKASLDRLKEYKKKFPDYICLSLKGGRGYWRKNMMLVKDDEEERAPACSLNF